jgi:hypothetical protein
MKTQSKINHVNRILKLHTRARKQYEQAEQLFCKLAAAVPVGEVIDAGELGQFTIVDNFANTNSAFRVARVARLELKPVKNPAVKPQKSAPLDSGPDPVEAAD